MPPAAFPTSAISCAGTKLNAPLKRNVTIQDVGGAALFLLSELGAGVSGEVMHVDSGYHTVGMVAVEEAAEVAELLQSLKPAT